MKLPKFSSSLGHLETVLPYLKHHRWHLLAGFLFMIIQNIGYMRIPLHMQKLLDEITTANRWPMVREQLILALAFTLLTAITMFFMRNLIIGSSRRIEYELRARIFSKILKLNYEFYQQQETGDIVSRCTNDLNDVRTLLGPGLMYVPNALSRMVLFFPILFSLSFPLMTVVCGLLTLLTILIVTIMPVLRPMYRRIQESVADINSRVWQIVSGIQTIKLYSLEENESTRFAALNRTYVQRQMSVAKLRGFLWPFFITLLATTELVILLVGGRQVIAGELSIGELFQFNIMVGYLSFPVLSLGWVLSLLQQGLSAMERINYLLQQPEEESIADQTLEDEHLEIQLKGLSYRYPNSKGNVLDDVDMTFAAGTTIGITGTIGSGKTTLLKLLTGLIKPGKGMILINQRDLLDIRPEELYRRISFVPQDTFLFSRSIARNIALSEESKIDDDRIEQAATRAGLVQDILSFPNMYQEQVGERGITMSGGQKQRTAIARALYRVSPLIIFDDALSSVDAKTESAILEGIRKIGTDRTIIIVSHRISALKNSDLIYVMDDGHVVDSGTHDALLSRKEGLYARLAKLQQMEQALTEVGHGE